MVCKLTCGGAIEVQRAPRALVPVDRTTLSFRRVFIYCVNRESQASRDSASLWIGGFNQQ